MRKILTLVGLALILIAGHELGYCQSASDHAVVKVAQVVSAPVVHPKRTLKQIAGSILFGIEPVADIAHASFDALDKVSSDEKYFGAVHLVFHAGDVVAAKADSGLEGAEQYFFGSSN